MIKNAVPFVHTVFILNSFNVPYLIGCEPRRGLQQKWRSPFGPGATKVGPGSQRQNGNSWRIHIRSTVLILLL